MRTIKINVHPSFKRKLKIMAAEDNTSMIKLTKKLANDDEINKVLGWKRNEKAKKYEFKL